MSEDKLLVKKEVCEYLRIASATLDRLIRDKEIPFIKLGKGRGSKVLFRKSDIDNFLESRKVEKK